MKMNILACVALAAVVAACDNPLDTDPTASIDAETALSNARGIELGLNGAYRSIQGNFARVELAFPDLYSDNLDFTGTFTGDREVSIRAIQPNNGEVGAIWWSASTYQRLAAAVTSISRTWAPARRSLS